MANDEPMTEGSVSVVESRGGGYYLRFVFEEGDPLYSQNTFKTVDDAVNALKRWCFDVGGRTERAQ